jgi:hypothetical protein
MGGRGRSRTQRRHFKQSRDNVWKRPKSDPSSDNNNNNNENDKPNWQPFATQNPAFDEYYKVLLPSILGYAFTAVTSSFTIFYFIFSFSIRCLIYLIGFWVLCIFWWKYESVIFFFFKKIFWMVGARDGVPRRVGLLHGSSSKTIAWPAAFRINSR